MLRVSIVSLKEGWVEILSREGLGIFDAMVLLASEDEGKRGMEEILDL